MIPSWRQITAIVGAGALGLAVVFLLSGGANPSLERLAEGAAWIVAFLALVVAIRGLRRGGPTAESTVAGFAAHVERPATDDPRTGAALEEAVEAAIQRARTDGGVDAGITAIRPRLRETVVGVLVAAGASRRDALQAVATGRWTADPDAAAVLAERPVPPTRTFSRRFACWLLPGAALEHRLERTVRAIECLAQEELSTLPGQTAPRTVPVHRRLGADAGSVWLERPERRRDSATHSSDPDGHAHADRPASDDADQPPDRTADARPGTRRAPPGRGAIGRASDGERITEPEVGEP